MIIKKVKYCRFPDTPREWCIVGKDEDHNEDYVTFGNLNLLVGKNAAGKSRALVAFRELAGLICGHQLVKDTSYHTQNFDFIFEDEGNEYRYILHFKEREILEEILYFNGKEVLSREKGFVFFLDKKINISSDFDSSKLLINMMSNNGSYYFEKLVFWARALVSVMFADQIEKNKYIEDLNVLKESCQTDETLGFIIPIFYWGRKEFGQKFENDILDSMNALGYELTDIDIQKSKRGYSISVEEQGKYMVSQQEMSQGMFRVLAFFVLLANAKWRNLSICILLDDVGEGLDHEKAKIFIEQVIRRIYNSQIQYFMTTNDRYVMNYIHLKYWTIVERENGKSICYNIYNSKKNFEDFKYTGLNNFDFFTTDFYRDGFGDDDQDEE